MTEISRAISRARFRPMLLALQLAVLALVLLATRAHATAQRVGDFEVALDAPWRMEPRGGDPVACDPSLGCAGAGYSYGAIPLQLSITDADMPDGAPATLLQKLIATDFELAALWRFVENEVRNSFGWVFDFIGYLPGLASVEQIDPLDPQDPAFHQPIKLEQFVQLRVAEYVGGAFQPQEVYGINDFHEVESTRGYWKWAPDQQGPESTSTPPARPFHSICRVWDGEDCRLLGSLRGTSEWHAIAMYEPLGGQVGDDVRLELTLVVLTDRDTIEEFTHYVQVHFGEAPLPRFGDSRWVYGDLHYHSQGTDNDGESGYAYRGVLQAMSAIGLDFVFATDHASNSPQIAAVRPAVGPQLVEPIFRGVRDMSPDRFAFNLDSINGPGGANEEVLSYGRYVDSAGTLQAAPQIFLGAEVDVIPEFEINDPPPVSYTRACEELPWIMKMLALLNDQNEVLENLSYDPFGIPSAQVCDDLLTDIGGERRLIRDVQGPDNGHFLSDRFFARQHLLHLPVDPTRADEFIASNTSKYGGATRRLGEILSVELDQRQKGFALLAHPFSRATGSDVGRAGPDIVPYSLAQLRDAFASEYVIGMQSWNENSQMSSPMGEFDAKDDGRTLVPVAQLDSWLHRRQKRKHLTEELLYWDQMLLWGIEPAQTASLSWLPEGEPRRLFLAGGSDAHGDLNYRREGAFVGTSSVNDTAIGTPRNLVFAGEPEGALVGGPSGNGVPNSQQQVVDALRAGNFSVTDGPALRVAYDANRNGAIDDNDVPMGGVAVQHGGALQFVVEWESTEEFGRVEQIEMLLGVDSDAHPYGLVYRGEMPAANDHAYVFIDPATGDEYVRTPRILYWHEPTSSTLWIDVPASEGFSGRRTVVIAPSDFPVGLAHAVCPDDAQMDTVRMAVSTGTGGSGGFEWEEGPWQPPGGTLCDFEQVFENPVTPDRLYLRAEARNEMAPGSNPVCDPPNVPVSSDDVRECIYRRAYSNPVWVNYDEQYTPVTPYEDLESSLDTGTSTTEPDPIDIYADPTGLELSSDTGSSGSGTTALDLSTRTTTTTKGGSTTTTTTPTQTSTRTATTTFRLGR